MLVSNLFSRTRRDVAGESRNYQLLTKAGYIDQLMAGVFTFLPLGNKVLKKIENIIREEMVSIGGEEVLMPALHPKEIWKATNRWEEMDDLYRFTTHYSKQEVALGATHEEVVTPLAKKFIFSYKELPKYLFQIQVKFRDEKRPRSGLLRTREFIMKDLYSFHKDKKDLDDYYERVKEAYAKVFLRIGLGNITFVTYASGGTFSKYSHEYQTLCSEGEDTIFLCKKCRVAINKEIIVTQKECPSCGKADFEEKRAIEVGNIFKLGSRFSSASNLKFKDKDGKEKLVEMGCYGMGPTRIMGAVAEVLSDDRGLAWPKEITPYQVYFINIGQEKKAESFYNLLQKKGFEILWDERDESPGIKFADADLLGIPIRLVVSEKSLSKGGIEIKYRNESAGRILKNEDIIKELAEFYA